MPTPQLFSVLTTCKPAGHPAEFFGFNECVRCCLYNQWPCVILNAPNEVPNEISKQDGVRHVIPIGLQKRPILSDFIAASDADWLIISNSDVWITADWVPILQFLEQNDVHFASSRRWDLPEDIRVSELPVFDKLTVAELRKIAKRQSKRTLDVFLVRKTAIEVANVVNPNIGALVPGTVGFDNNLLGLMGEICKTADLSDVLDIFHTNHEPFRKVYLRNHLVSLKDQFRFIKKRHQQRVLVSKKGCLTWSDYRIKLTNTGVTAKKNKFQKIRYYIESARIKLVNKADIWIFIFNKRCFEFLRDRTVLTPGILICGIVIVYPSLRRQNKQTKRAEFGEAVAENVNGKVNEWKAKLSTE